LGVTAALLGNIGHVPLTEGLGLTRYGDFGLNVFNSRSLEYLRRKGLQGACVSFELRFSQIRDLAKCLPAEAIVYGRLPLMITEHDLTAGGVTALRDRPGAEFPLLSAFGRRPEIQHSRPLWMADRTDWRRLGLATPACASTTETAAECVRVFRDYLTGAAPEGTFTRGLYERGAE
jgi:putative protease